MGKPGESNDTPPGIQGECGPQAGQAARVRTDIEHVAHVRMMPWESLNARGSCERAGPVGWGKPATLQRNSLSRPLGRRGASPRRGRVAGPEGLVGKTRKVSDLVVVATPEHRAQTEY